MDACKNVKKNSVLQKSTFVLAVTIFFVVCLLGSRINAEPIALVASKKLENTSNLQLIALENETDSCQFQLFYGSNGASAFIFPHSVFHFNAKDALLLSNKDLAIIKCCKGSFLPVFVQHGDAASGDKQEGFDGPFYISMWLGYPQVPETAKTHIRYMVKSGSVGKVGIKIGTKGDYRFVAYDNVHFIS